VDDPDELAFAQGMCNATFCGLVDAAAHPVQTAGGLLIMAANSTAPTVVETVAPDLSVKHMATEFAARVRDGDPEALGELTGMGMLLLVGGGESGVARGASAGAPADDLAAVESQAGPGNPVLGLPRRGSALRIDVPKPETLPKEGGTEFPQQPVGHGFPDLVDKYAGLATPFDLRNGTVLHQLDGSQAGLAGRFEWIVDGGTITHRMFVRGPVNGVPIR
jgi:hypothetical protein